MTKYQIQCPQCGMKLNFSENLLGQTRSCPKCKTPITLEAGGGGTTAPRQPASPAPPPEKRVSPAAAAPAPGAAPVSKPKPVSSSSAFPERMKANRALAGRVCPVCSMMVDLGDDIFNCRRCGEPMHLQCYEQAGRCQSAKCLAAPSRPAAETAVQPSAPPPDKGATKECRFCGEPIRLNAIKCRHCGEYQRDEDRKVASQGSERDALTTAEIVFGILCGGIACIVGIVWALQGKPKGKKLILLSILSMIVWTFIRLMIESAFKGH
jgi:hypothetical protein